ncbi:MAG: FliM/FliN family flagellar motor switch protein [Gemmatimonadota bacterium]
MTNTPEQSAGLGNVAVDVVVELARKEIALGEARRLKKGDVIRFGRLAGEAFDVLVNQRKFGEGEIVVVTDLMAIRLTRLFDREVPR